MCKLCVRQPPHRKCTKNKWSFQYGLFIPLNMHYNLFFCCTPLSQTMHAHSQFCMSGDYTLEGTEYAMKELVREEADEHFVIVLSDANLERYGISPDRFARTLTSNPQVNAFAIFIGSLGDQADR